jgi:sortase A
VAPAHGPATTAPPAVATGTPIEPPADPRAPEPEVVIGSIEIPRISLVAPLNEGISLTTIDRGPSHWPGSALPGQVGNAVVAGHRVTKTRPFRDIDRLVPGDEVVLTGAGVRATYVVNGSEVVAPDAMRIVDPTPTATLTLFACHPPGSARYRYVVTADLVRTDVLLS